MNRKKYFMTGVLVTIAVLFGTALLALGIHIHFFMSRNMEKMKLQSAIPYDSMVKQSLKDLAESDIRVVLYGDGTENMVTNSDFGRSVSGKVMAVAGDASVLFPESNVLAFGETGYCLLGEGLSVKLFGSTKVNGRSVEVDGKRYAAAGIIWGKDWDDYCVYQADEQAREEMAGAAYGFDSAKKRRIVEQTVRNRLGV